jgi:hypothetical protein
MRLKPLVPHETDSKRSFNDYPLMLGDVCRRRYVNAPFRHKSMCSVMKSSDEPCAHK